MSGLSTGVSGTFGLSGLTVTGTEAPPRTTTGTITSSSTVSTVSLGTSVSQFLHEVLK